MALIMIQVDLIVELVEDLLGTIQVCSHFCLHGFFTVVQSFILPHIFNSKFWRNRRILRYRNWLEGETFCFHIYSSASAIFNFRS